VFVREVAAYPPFMMSSVVPLEPPVVDTECIVDRIERLTTILDEIIPRPVHSRPNAEPIEHIPDLPSSLPCDTKGANTYQTSYFGSIYWCPFARDTVQEVPAPRLVSPIAATASLCSKVQRNLTAETGSLELVGHGG